MWLWRVVQNSRGKKSRRMKGDEEELKKGLGCYCAGKENGDGIMTVMVNETLLFIYIITAMVAVL